MTTDAEAIVSETRRAFVANIVARGHGTISAGNGMIVAYGPEPGPTGRGIVFIPNTVHDEEAEVLLFEALALAPTIPKTPLSKKSKRDDEIVPSEE